MRPGRTALLCWSVSPGAHLLLSIAVERRRVTWRTEYPAVLAGDTALAVAAGLHRWAAGPPPSTSDGWRRWLRRASVPAGLAYGAWQLRQEIRTGFLDPPVAFGPTKLWHQFVVYPVLGRVVAESLADGTAAALRPGASRDRVAAVAAGWACAVVWAGLVVEAWRTPRQAHGTWPRRVARR